MIKRFLGMGEFLEFFFKRIFGFTSKSVIKDRGSVLKEDEMEVNRTLAGFFRLKEGETRKLHHPTANRIRHTYEYYLFPERYHAADAYIRSEEGVREFFNKCLLHFSIFFHFNFSRLMITPKDGAESIYARKKLFYQIICVICQLLIGKDCVDVLQCREKIEEVYSGFMWKTFYRYTHFQIDKLSEMDEGKIYEMLETEMETICSINMKPSVQITLTQNGKEKIIDQVDFITQTEKEWKNWKDMRSQMIEQIDFIEKLSLCQTQDEVLTKITEVDAKEKEKIVSEWKELCLREKTNANLLKEGYAKEINMNLRYFESRIIYKKESPDLELNDLKGKILYHYLESHFHNFLPNVARSAHSLHIYFEIAWDLAKFLDRLNKLSENCGFPEFNPRQDTGVLSYPSFIDTFYRECIEECLDYMLFQIDIRNRNECNFF